MKHIFLVLSVIFYAAPVFAIPPIEGFGKNATGGAGQSTCTVTSSNNLGAGTLDDCWGSSGSGNKIIQFSVDTVNLAHDLFGGSNMTVDGCLNGKNGITIIGDAAGNGKHGLNWEGPVSNIIVRCINFRQDPANDTTTSDELNFDGAGGNVATVLIERCTFWDLFDGDGCLDINSDASDFTIQYNLLYNCAKTQLNKYSTRSKISYHHNVFARNCERNPQIKGAVTKVDFVNNVIYDNNGFANLGLGYNCYGTRVWDTNSSSDSLPAGAVGANFTNNAWIATTVEHIIDSGAPSTGLHESGSLCKPTAGDCVFTPTTGTSQDVTGFEITTIAAGCLNTILSNVGAPNRTSADSTIFTDLAAEPYWSSASACGGQGGALVNIKEFLGQEGDN